VNTYTKSEDSEDQVSATQESARTGATRRARFARVAHAVRVAYVCQCQFAYLELMHLLTRAKWPTRAPVVNRWMHWRKRWRVVSGVLASVVLTARRHHICMCPLRYRHAPLSASLLLGCFMMAVVWSPGVPAAHAAPASSTTASTYAIHSSISVTSLTPMLIHLGAANEEGYAKPAVASCNGRLYVAWINAAGWLTIGWGFHWQNASPASSGTFQIAVQFAVQTYVANHLNDTTPGATSQITHTSQTGPALACFQPAGASAGRVPAAAQTGAPGLTGLMGRGQHQAPATANRASHLSRLYVAWTDTATYLHIGYFDGIPQHAILQQQMAFPDTTTSSPSLTIVPGNRLLVAFTGTDPNHSLNVEASADGVAWNKAVWRAQSSSGGPGIATFCQRSTSGVPGLCLVLLAWIGSDRNATLNLATFDPTTASFQFLKTLWGDSSAYGDELSLTVWQHTAVLLYVSPQEVGSGLLSSDGMTWTPTALSLGHAVPFAGIAAAHDDHHQLWMAFDGPLMLGEYVAGTGSAKGIGSTDKGHGS